MSLPPPGPLELETVTVGKTEVKVRPLRLYEVRSLAKLGPEESDARAVALALDVSDEDATEWLAQAKAGDAAQLLAGIMRASGWDPGAGARFPT